jgi:hypothetical protein
MHRLILTAVLAVFMLTVVTGQVIAAETAASGLAALALPGERFVPIAPCHLVDTRLEAAKTPAEALSRTLKMADTRCGEIIPRYAAAYAIRLLNIDRGGPENAPGAVTAAPAARLAGDATGAMRFTIPPSSHLAVEVEGYYVPPGIPIDGKDTVGVTTAGQAASSPISGSSQSSSVRLPKTDVVSTDQTKGDLFLDASTPLTATGARLEAHATHPFTVLRPGSNNGAVIVYSADATNPTELLRITPTGGNPAALQMGDGTYMSGRFNYVPQVNHRTPTNIVHSILFDYPLDANGGSTDRVVFYNAATNQEFVAIGNATPGPPTTKFRAFTMGYWYDTVQTNINFDSQVHYHTGQYYFRGYSDAENKDTFWVKASPSATGSITSGTRAKMYVSGPAGFGTDTPLDAVHIKGSPAGTGSAAVRVEEGTAAGVALLGSDNVYGPYLVSHTDTQWNATIGTSAHRIRFGMGLLAIEFAASVPTGSARTFVPRLQIDSTGSVPQVLIGTAAQPSAVSIQGSLSVSGDITGAHVINATYQDMAEWVPASASMEPGTVVVVDPTRKNGVIPSTVEYDTSVAGVVSAQPGVLLGIASDSKAMIATTGRVKVRVDAGRGAIHAGDLLVTGNKPGVAMRSEPIDLGGIKIHRPGTLIGKALEPLEIGEESILVLLSLQ